MIRYQITDGLVPVRPGVDFVQIRNPALSARELARVVRSMAAGPRILVNDRADVALACGAAGVHLRAGSVAPRTIRELGKMIVTVACHSEEEVRQAEGADYALLSPVFLPLSKLGSPEPLGLREFERITKLSPVPVIALGGITLDNLNSCLSAGAVGIAAISLFR